MNQCTGPAEITTRFQEAWNVHDMEAFANEDGWDKRAPDCGVHNDRQTKYAPNGNSACASAARFMGSNEGAHEPTKKRIIPPPQRRRVLRRCH
jgi:hypothetical protein